MIRRHSRGSRRRPRGRRAVQALIGLLVAVLVGLGVLPGVATGSGPAPTRPAATHAAAAPRRAPVRPAAIPARPPAAAPVSTTGSVPTSGVRLVWGDTLWRLAREHSTTVGELQKLNNLGNSTLIYAGRILLVPAAGTQSIPQDRPPTAVGAPSNAQGQAPVAASGRAGALAVAFATAQLGVPYVWGGTGNGGYDCSGLVQAAWRAAGVQLPRTTYDQVHVGRPTTRAALVPGDLVFSNGDGHVQIYIGGGQVIEAPHPGAGVHVTALPHPWEVNAYVHLG